MSAAAVIILRRKKFIRRFAEQGATSPDRAISFADVGMRRSWVAQESSAGDSVCHTPCGMMRGVKTWNFFVLVNEKRWSSFPDDPHPGIPFAGTPMTTLQIPGASRGSRIGPPTGARMRRSHWSCYRS
jgi:hypothetical protein